MPDLLNNCIKFLRGSLEAYKNLKIKDSNTLYFIFDENNKINSLYLGDRLIGGGENSIKDIKEISLPEKIIENSFLVYKNGKWTNETLNTMKGATIKTKGEKGLVPAPAPGETDYFLRGDGTWAPAHSNIPINSDTLKRLNEMAKWLEENPTMQKLSENIEEMCEDLIKMETRVGDLSKIENKITDLFTLLTWQEIGGEENVNS